MHTHMYIFPQLCLSVKYKGTFECLLFPLVLLFLCMVVTVQL